MSEMAQTVRVDKVFPACRQGSGSPNVMETCRFAFGASTGRTATMFIARTLNAIPGVAGLHEGHSPGEPPIPRLPLINLQNRKAWHDTDFAARTIVEMRPREKMLEAAADYELLVDVAFYNAPLLLPLAVHFPDSPLLVIFRRCESFVQSATIVSGEDLQPAGWPEQSKPLTDREKFIALGRLSPKPGCDDAERWGSWSAIQRNIWLWHSVNSHLLRVAEAQTNCYPFLYEALVDDPTEFWSSLLRALDIHSETNLRICVARSGKKLNDRPSYQVGPIATWNDAERELYSRLAQPLEERLYG